MYQFLIAYVLPIRTGSNWLQSQLTNLSVADIFSRYRSVILKVKLVDVDQTVYVDMDKYRTSHNSFQNDINIFLQSMSGRSLHLTEYLPHLEVGYAKYFNTFANGFHVNCCTIGEHSPINAPLSTKLDLVFTSSQQVRDLKLIHKYCLVTVNGYIHNTASDLETSYVIDGGRSCQYAKNNQIGIISFIDLGELEKCSIDSDMVRLPVRTDHLKDLIEIKLPRAVNKSFFLVVGGVIVHPQDDVMYLVNEDTVHLQIDRIPYIERLLESREFIDLSSLRLAESTTNSTMINRSDALSDDVIRRYLTMSQSFVVYVDVDHLAFSRSYIKNVQSPGQFTTTTEPLYPIVVSTGRLADYWKVKEDHYWSVTVTDSFARQWMHHKETKYRVENVAKQLHFDIPYRHSQGYMLEISGYNNQP